MSFLPRIALKFAGSLAAKRFEEATRDPVSAQRRKLLSIVEANRDTEYGREHGFRRVSDLESWRHRVPVIDYEAIRGMVERTARGEVKALGEVRGAAAGCDGRRPYG